MWLLLVGRLSTEAWAYISFFRSTLITDVSSWNTWAWNWILNTYKFCFIVSNMQVWYLFIYSEPNTQFIHVYFEFKLSSYYKYMFYLCSKQRTHNGNWVLIIFWFSYMHGKRKLWLPWNLFITIFSLIVFDLISYYLTTNHFFPWWCYIISAESCHNDALTFSKPDEIF